MKKKTKIIAAVALCVLCAICAAYVIINGGDKYREICIYDMSGNAKIERDGAGALDAYIGMTLRSGDVIKTDSGCTVYLKMDNDKYALIEEESVVLIKVSGDGKHSRTEINMEKGAITSRIDNKLSADSVYSVTSPNSTVYVSGTVFRVMVTDQNGETVTHVYTFDGEVSIGDNIIGNGANAVISGSGKRDEIEVILFSNYYAQPISVLEFLKSASDEGRAFSINSDDIQAIIDEKNQEN